MEGQPSENVQQILDGMTAYARDDDEALRAWMHPEIEIHSDQELVNAGTFFGWEGWKRWTAQWDAAWEEISYEPIEFIEVDEHLVVVPVRYVGKGRGSGVEVEAEFSWIYEIRDRKCTRFHAYANKERALEVAGSLSGSG